VAPARHIPRIPSLLCPENKQITFCPAPLSYNPPALFLLGKRILRQDFALFLGDLYGQNINPQEKTYLPRF
jgi:hypothetical protein